PSSNVMQAACSGSAARLASRLRTSLKGRTLYSLANSSSCRSKDRASRWFQFETGRGSAITPWYMTMATERDRRRRKPRATPGRTVETFSSLCNTLPTMRLSESGNAAPVHGLVGPQHFFETEVLAYRVTGRLPAVPQVGWIVEPTHDGQRQFVSIVWRNQGAGGPGHLQDLRRASNGRADHRHPGR